MLTCAIQVLEALAFRGILERTALVQACEAAAAEHAAKMNPASLRRWFEVDGGRHAFINPADADECRLRKGYGREAADIFEACIDLAGLIHDELHAG
jgi:O-phosphoseryl-tRNA(Cys) synthetase